MDIATAANIVLAAALVLSNGYFVYWRPQRRRAGLLAAVPLLDSELRRDLEKAETRLVEALSAGLGRRDTRDARFALAWTRARLGHFDPARYGDALATLAVSDAAADSDPAVTDLRLWLLAQQGKHDEILGAVERQPELAERPRNRPLYAAALEHRAVDLWTRRDVDAAVRTLDQARRLRADSGVRLRDLVELLLEHGMRLVTDGDLAGADESFDRAGRMAAAGSVQRIEARLGRLVCRWQRGDRADMLGALAEEFDGLRRRGEQRGPGQDDVRLLRAHVGWWYLVAMLEDWMHRLPAGQWLPTDERERFLAVVRTVSDADPELGDVIMMQGMLDYGLSSGPDEALRAVQTLDRSTRTAKGVLLPKVSGIIQRFTGRRPAGTAGPDGPEPDATPAAEPVDYPHPPPAGSAVPWEVLLEQAQVRMHDDPAVRAAMADLERLRQFLATRIPPPEESNGEQTPH